MLKKIGQAVGRGLKRFGSFCARLLRNPAKREIIIAIAGMLLVACVALGAVTVTTARSRTVELGFRNIGELSTQAVYYTNVQVIKSSRQLFNIDIPFTGNRYIFSYDGVIKAGVNFEEIEVTVSDVEKTILVRMPPVMITSNQIDHNSLEIYDETKSVFNPLKLGDVNLSIIAMEEESEKTAIENGLFENARANAETLIRGMLSSMFDLEAYTVTFEWKTNDGQEGA